MRNSLGNVTRKVALGLGLMMGCASAPVPAQESAESSGVSVPVVPVSLEDSLESEIEGVRKGYLSFLDAKAEGPQPDKSEVACDRGRTMEDAVKNATGKARDGLFKRLKEVLFNRDGRGKVFNGRGKVSRVVGFACVKLIPGANPIEVKPEEAPGAVPSVKSGE